MRIGCCGAGGTGKTTTLNLVAKELPGLTLVRSGAREVFERWGIDEKAQRDMGPRARYSLQQEIAKLNLSRIRLNGRALFERTPLDMAAYTLWRCEEVMSKEEILDLLEETKSHLDLFELIFFFPVIPSWEDITDGLREDHLAGRMEHELLVLGLAYKFGTRVITMEEGTPEQRAAFLLRTYKDWTGVP